MTLAVKNPAIPEADPSEGSERMRAPRAGRPPSAFAVTEPAVDLLPPEIRAERKAGSTRRILIYSVLAVLLLVVLGAGGATALAVSQQSAVAQAQAETKTLLQQQQSFSKTQKAQQLLELAKAAQKVAGATEVNWLDTFTRIEATRPDGVLLSSLTADSASPIALYAQPTSPLQGPRVASVKVTALMGSLEPVAGWLTALGKLSGVTDAMTDDVSRDATTGVYTVAITIHYTDAAYDLRLTGKGK